LPVNPGAMLRTMAQAGVAGGVAAAIATFGFLVHANDFVVWAAVQLPFLIIGFYLYTRPAQVMLGRISIVFFTIMLYPVDLGRFNVPLFAGRFLAILFGMCLCGVAFGLFNNAAGNRFLYRRLVRKLRAEVSLACRNPLNIARQRLESATRDLFVQIEGYTVADSDTQRELWAWALSVLDVGRAVVDLRSDMAGASPRLEIRIERVLAAINALYDRPSRANHIQARRSVASGLRVAAEMNARGVQCHLHVLQLALLDCDSILGQYMPSNATAGQEAIHAT